MSQINLDWTDEQKAIINPAEWGNAVITACAGSGKSTTIVQRCLVHANRLETWQVIALISFTNKSTQDLREKLSTDVKGQILVSTFHAFLINHILNFESLFRGKKLPFTYTNRQNSLLGWKNWIETHHQIPFARDAKNDYLFEHALDLLQSQVVQEYLKSKFHAIYIDEAQDNNALQYQIVDLLISFGIECVLVGDPQQTIYGFRGADSNKFNALSESLVFRNSGGIFHLTLNFRCNRLIDKWAKEKRLPTQSDYETVESERHGVFLNYKLENLLINEKIIAEGCTVLVNSNAQLEALENTSLKIFKTIPLLDNSINHVRLSNLYKLVLLKDEFNEYHFINLECPDGADTKLIKALQNFKKAPTSDNLTKLNNLFQVIEADKIDEFITSLSDSKVSGYFTIKPNDCIAMTIHSAKGLEFDNVIVYANDFSNIHWSDEDKRKHYVAFTRAKKRLFIL